MSRLFLSHVHCLCRALPGCCQQFVFNVSCPSGRQSSLVIAATLRLYCFPITCWGCFLSELSLITAENVSDGRVKASVWFSDWHKQEWSNDLEQHECQEIWVLALFDACLAFTNITKIKKARQRKKGPLEFRTDLSYYHISIHTHTHISKIKTVKNGEWHYQMFG